MILVRNSFHVSFIEFVELNKLDEFVKRLPLKSSSFSYIVWVLFLFFSYSLNALLLQTRINSP